MKNIPHEKGLPLVGQGLQILQSPLKFLVHLAHTYDEVVRVRVAGRTFYVILDPDIIRRILQENFWNYYKPGLARELKRFLGEGLATSNGEFWRQQRRLIQPAFHRKRIEKLVSVIDEETSKLIAQWKAQGSPDVKLINNDFLKVTLANINRTMFGADVHENIDQIAETVNRLLQYGTKRAVAPIRLPHYLPTPANLRFRKANRELDAVIARIIAERDAATATASQERGVLDILLRARDEGTSPGLTERQLRDEIMTIFMAGHETTAQTLSWIFYELAAHPEVAERVRAEADALGSAPLTHDGLEQLSYTKAVIEETLRLYPPVWVIVRRAGEADQLTEEFRLPAGATVLLNIYGLHHNRKFWPDPEHFDPNNIMAAREAGIPDFAYLPFGGGPRICIGNHFAMMVMQTVITRLTRAFTFEVPAGFQPVVKPGFTLRAKGGIRLKVSKREPTVISRL